MLKRVALAVLGVVTAAVCFAVAAALAMLAAEKAATDISRGVASLSEVSGIAPDTIMSCGILAVALLAVAAWRPRRGGRGGYRIRRYSRPARRRRRW